MKVYINFCFSTIDLTLVDFNIRQIFLRYINAWNRFKKFKAARFRKIICFENKTRRSGLKNNKHPRVNEFAFHEDTELVALAIGHAAP